MHPKHLRTLKDFGGSEHPERLWWFSASCKAFLTLSTLKGSGGSLQTSQGEAGVQMRIQIFPAPPCKGFSRPSILCVTQTALKSYLRT